MKTFSSLRKRRKMAKAKNDNSIKEHSQTMSLLGEKLALMKLLNKIQEDINDIDAKLHKIKKKKMFGVLKGDR